MILGEDSMAERRPANRHRHLQQQRHPGVAAGSMGSRRIFAPSFKLRVLDSYRNDIDCRGNQRATARKYGIHRRQIQKWLQCEENLRNSCAPRRKDPSLHLFSPSSGLRRGRTDSSALPGERPSELPPGPVCACAGAGRLEPIGDNCSRQGCPSPEWLPRRSSHSSDSEREIEGYAERRQAVSSSDSEFDYSSSRQAPLFLRYDLGAHNHCEIVAEGLPSPVDLSAAGANSHEPGQRTVSNHCCLMSCCCHCCLRMPKVDRPSQPSERPLTPAIIIHLADSTRFSDARQSATASAVERVAPPTPPLSPSPPASPGAGPEGGPSRRTIFTHRQQQESPLCLVKPRTTTRLPADAEDAEDAEDASARGAILFRPYLDQPISRPPQEPRIVEIGETAVRLQTVFAGLKRSSDAVAAAGPASLLGMDLDLSLAIESDFNVCYTDKGARALSCFSDIETPIKSAFIKYSSNVRYV